MKEEKLKLIKFNIHSIVQIITNSSTVIFTYQDSISEVKALVEEVLKISGEDFRSADDIFHYGVFCEDSTYFERDLDFPKDMPEVTGSWGSDERKESQAKLDEWFAALKVKIMSGEIEQPKWMTDAEEAGSYDYWAPSRYLCLMPKKKKYAELGNKIEALLNSVGADGGRDG
jgi:hypothetical protein